MALPPAQASASATPGSSAAPSIVPTERPLAEGPDWDRLTPAQRAALEPLAREWASIDGNRRQKWLEIAARLPRMSPEARARMQARMSEWARMTPQQRAQVRLHFQEARQVTPQQRKERWEAYQALTPEQRLRLAERATPGSPSAPARSPADPARRRTAEAARSDDAQPKSNLVVVPQPEAAPRPVAPTVVQAQPGATTTLMSRRPTPPLHQQPGLPKIAATPEFVDRATLLPQRGAQAAAVRPVAASEAVPARR